MKLKETLCAFYSVYQSVEVQVYFPAFGREINLCTLLA